MRRPSWSTAEGSDTELKCVQDARVPESKNYGFPVKLWLSPDNSVVKSGFQCWIPWIPSRFRLDFESSVRDSGVCRTPQVQLSNKTMASSMQGALLPGYMDTISDVLSKKDTS